MISTALLPRIDESTASVGARIDAQEEDFALPLREYLESNGCEVFSGQHSSRSVAYHIVCGDLHFVKDIFSSPSKEGVRQLGIVMGLSLSDAQNLANDQRKIIVVDPVRLTEVDVVEIFSFFFTAGEMFSDKRRNRHEPAPIVAESMLSQEDSTRISSIIFDMFPEKSETIQKQRKRKIKINVWKQILILICMIAFPVIWYIGSLTIAEIAFTYAAMRMKNGTTNGVTKMTSVGRYWLTQSRFVLGFIGVPFKYTGLTHIVRNQERVLSFLTDVAQSLEEGQKMVSSEKNVASLLLHTNQANENVTPASEIHKLRLSVTSVSGSLGLAQAELTALLRDETFPFIFPPVFRLGTTMLRSLESVRGVLTYVDHVLTLYPHLAGFKEIKTYLVLLQNSNELRPTGGFIGSVGIAKFEDGFLSDFTISDVYALDGQLKGHVDPPLPIAELMGNEHWYLRDSNWDPDFKVSAERAIFFYEKESGEQVDGVIAVNVPVVVDLLKATGPIFLPDYNDRITAENFFGKSIFYTQENSFAGSTQKSDFLGSLTRSLMTKVTTDRDISPVTLFHAFASGISRRDIVFMFKDTSLQQLVEHFGWSGRVFEKSGCEGVSRESCLFDQLAIAEANVSVSKVNYFIKRNSVHEIIIAPDGELSEHVTIRLRNTVNLAENPNARGVGGAYTTYMRFFMPADSSVSDVTLDGVPIPSRIAGAKKLPSIPYIEKTDALPNSHGIGVAFTVEPGSERSVRISYKRKTPLPFGRGGAVLDLLWYKHPGVSDNEAKTIISYPVFWVASDETLVKDVAPNIAKDGQLEYNTTILKDQSIRLKFTK